MRMNDPSQMSGGMRAPRIHIDRSWLINCEPRVKWPALRVRLGALFARSLGGSFSPMILVQIFGNLYEDSVAGFVVISVFEIVVHGHRIELDQFDEAAVYGGVFLL